MRWLLCIGFLAFLSNYSLAQTHLKLRIEVKDFDKDLLAEAIFDATNRLREKKGVPALLKSESLKDAAQYQAQRMASKERLVHNWPRGEKFSTPRKRMEAFGAQLNTSGENIARDYILDIPSGESYFISPQGYAIDAEGRRILNRSYERLAQKVVGDWYRSPGHRENLLGDFKYLGVGVSKLVPEKKGPNFDVYLVQNFGK